jgi:ribosomal protein S18 acetylase RimI-like enzyme
VPDVGVELEPITPDRYAAWRERSVREYGEAHAATGDWPADEAHARAEREFAELLPDGPATPGNWLWSIVDPGSREPVGVLWVAERDRPSGRGLYIYDIRVDEDSRGRGYGGGALRALERFARERGFASLRLHVFGDNDVARGLYRREGFIETNVMMEKVL